MPTILFIDYHFPAAESGGHRTLRLLQSLASCDYRPLVAAGPIMSNDAELGDTIVRHIDGNGNWSRAAIDAVDSVASGSVALLAVLTRPENAFVASELSARWNVPWIGDVPDIKELAADVESFDGEASGAGTLRSTLGSAHAFTVRTTEEMTALLATLPELGLKHLACVPERPSDPGPAELVDVLEHVVPRRLRNEMPGRHLRVVSYAG